MPQFRNLRIIALLSLLTTHCGTVTEQLVGTAKTQESLVTLKGYVSESFGSTGDLDQWHLILVNRTTEISQISDLAKNGSYEFSFVDPSQDYSFVLFTPDWKFAATTALRTSTPSVLSRYVGFTSSQLPTLIYRGMTLDFLDKTNLLISSQNQLVDANNNTIPDAMENIWSLGLTASHDGDNDGIPDMVDGDDDQDGIPDFFDSDSNQDNVLDILNFEHDNYWDHFLSYSAITLEKIMTSATESEHYLTFSAQLNGGEFFSSVKILGPSSVITDGISIFNDDNSSEEAWSFSLFDDGLHFDGAQGDGLYRAKIKLQGSLPSYLQACFFQFTFGDSSQKSFGQLLPYGTFSDVSLSHDSTGLITRTGNPFGSQTAYQWMILFYDSDGQLIFSTAELSSETVEYQIPDHLLTGAFSYHAVLQSPQRILSQPALILQTLSVSYP